MTAELLLENKQNLNWVVAGDFASLVDISLDEITTVTDFPDVIIQESVLDMSLDLNYAYNVFNSYQADISNSMSQMAQIATRCMCPAEMGMSGVLYSAQSSYINYMNPSEVGDGHKHGHCSKHPEAHFEEGEKCPECG